MGSSIGRRRLLAVAAAGVLGATLWPGSRTRAAAEGPLRLAFIPQENPEKLLDDITVINDWLAAEIGVPVEGFVTFDHAAAIEALRNQSADIS
ncbi:MAG: PhnD/SsuA/transferrin family substrate-binding protein, partial [Geminicoccaceae bacterium]